MISANRQTQTALSRLPTSTRRQPPGTPISIGTQAEPNTNGWTYGCSIQCVPPNSQNYSARERTIRQFRQTWEKDRLGVIPRPTKKEEEAFRQHPQRCPCEIPCDIPLTPNP